MHNVINIASRRPGRDGMCAPTPAATASSARGGGISDTKIPPPTAPEIFAAELYAKDLTTVAGFIEACDGSQVRAGRALDRWMYPHGKRPQDGNT